MERLLEQVPWAHDRIMMFGREVVTKRQVAWYGDPGLVYRYSGRSKSPLPWLPVLLELKEKVEVESASTFNSCLLNFYRDGTEGMGWHADDERELEPNGTIASLSLGATRDFEFRHKTDGLRVGTPLEHGALLVMAGVVQTFWKHRLPPRRRVKEARINLTFRTIKTT